MVIQPLSTRLIKPNFCLHKKTPVEMRGPGTCKHCVTNMAADEEAAIAAVIAAIFLVNKEKEENRETVLDCRMFWQSYIQWRGDTFLESRAM